MSSEPVIVIGAGLAGLTLARTLSKHSIKCVIYEGEAGPHIRGQGGSLDLRPDSGQKALEIAGAYEAWKNVARFDGEDIRILNKNGKILLEHCDESGYAPEIDRGQLRQLLLEGLEGEGSNTTIHWDHQLKEVTKINEGFLCKFANGNEVTAKTLVGADGAWSKVRTSLFKVGLRTSQD
ncbi:FAD binding domain-containing protein [Ditylenchus destructor]|uniref:FAD binding domain-containing protein n=1 Tax=Ditylenchus destructor TaxID=166010 RepID=A0AAD4MYJ7_9BILA|nr:FAD binding domain-containing protein [Ditylenchus destructor]